MGFFNTLGQIVEKTFEFLEKEQEKLNQAEENLDRKGFDSWDRERIEREYRYGNFYEKTVMKYKLEQKKAEKDDDDYNW